MKLTELLPLDSIILAINQLFLYKIFTIEAFYMLKSVI
jgi:hypothetical protein